MCCPWKWNAWNSVGIWDKNGLPNLGQKRRFYFNHQEEKNLSSMTVDNRIKGKKLGKLDKYLNLVWEMKNIKNILMILMVLGALGTDPKKLEKRLDELNIRGRIEPLQTKLTRILRRVLETWRDFSIIILSCHQHGYPGPSLATPPYSSSLPIGPQGYTSYSHIAAVCRFKLIALLLLGHVKGSIGIHHLWARPYFSSSVLHVWLV